MSKTAKSVYYFGIYLLLTGLNLMLVPNMLLGMLGLPPTDEVWIRVLGMVVFLIGVYYMTAGKNELWPFFKISLFTRPSVIIFFAIFVAVDWVGPSLLLFGVADLLGAVWTYTAMKKEGKL
jgi:hypothetical protein